MNGNAAVDYRNANLARSMGIKALAREQGPVGMAYFIQQFDRGEGNYSIERKSSLSDLTMKDALRELKEMRRVRFDSEVYFNGE